jgi:MOSC domain-containing protein YiiM
VCSEKCFVVSVNISEKKGIPKTPVSTAEFIADYGIKGDAHAGNWHRQVSLLAVESIDKIKSLGVLDIDVGRFAENITTKGVVLHKLPIGTILNIGDVVFEITQIGKECHQKCEIFHQIGDCIMPKEGIFAKVIIGGTIKKGDKIVIDGSAEKVV